jgi:hypothetical protein
VSNFTALTISPRQPKPVQSGKSEAEEDEEEDGDTVNAYSSNEEQEDDDYKVLEPKRSSKKSQPKDAGNARKPTPKPRNAHKPTPKPKESKQFQQIAHRASSKSLPGAAFKLQR